MRPHADEFLISLLISDRVPRTLAMDVWWWTLPKPAP